MDESGAIPALVEMLGGDYGGSAANAIAGLAKYGTRIQSEVNDRANLPARSCLGPNT